MLKSDKYFKDYSIEKKIKSVTLKNKNHIDTGLVNIVAGCVETIVQFF